MNPVASLITGSNLPAGETLFVTFRLAGSVSTRAFRALYQERQTAQDAARLLPAPELPAAFRRAEKLFFLGFDALLDAATVGPVFLEKEKIADIVAAELLLLEELGFLVVAFVLLPNHVHALLHLPAGSGVSFYKALELLQQRTAAQCRRLLQATLPPEADFWQTGSYDYPVHDATELRRLLTYLRTHATRTGHAGRWLDWPYRYVAPAYE
ncbi:hypothetical protein [Hymenobacter chitinivorans]|uniref:Transposase IS200-like domain-containing protein n=1 Tax=Hymenobacter chitinivorans DSM 11115 TaxID=1121954 RepID=A0A2M9ARY4_9BACT|nr:hypothetical protein [Hymenobacter chitinivorans]PJJ48439.1 hypothetical protein CLV45_4147 [Hymenobacter chitinivorans DSM 11115]